MLKILRYLTQEVDACHNFDDAYQLIVQRVRAAIDTQACSIFILDTLSNEYILMATDGLNPDSVHKVRIGVDEGLVGLIGQREEPINLENAREHPHFKREPAVCEEKLHAFLGVPIIHHGVVLGVLAVHQAEPRRFSESEEAFMVTVSVQLAGIIAQAQSTKETKRVGRFQNASNEIAPLSGMASVPGVGIGTAVVVYPLAKLKSVPDRDVEDIDEEIAVFNTALHAAREDIRILRERMSHTLPKEETALFDVYLRMLDNSGIGKQVIEEIKKGVWAQAALRNVIITYIRQYEEMEDEYLRERASDLRDLGRRILAHLQTAQPIARDYPPQTILVGKEVMASALAEVPAGRLAGVVSMVGSSNSHVAILARALGVPTVMGVDRIPLSSIQNCQIIVDGYYGKAYVEPSQALLSEFQRLKNDEVALNKDLEALSNLSAETPDGHQVALMVNMGLVADAGLALKAGAQGCGLYRTEIPFMTRDRFPAEEEQRVIYRQTLKSFSPHPVTIRTLDIGGDKTLPYFPIDERNPFLGWRGIRIMLDHPELFLVQIRAMLRASEGFDNLRIMIPMVSHIDEFAEAKCFIDQAYDEVLEEGTQIKKPPVGVMIEVPAAVYQARSYASRADFISVGSNDLTQYMLAVDRNNSQVASLYNSLHPSVLLALQYIVEQAKAEQCPVGLCGEMASDPVALILLLGMGFDSLSMNPTGLLRMKWVIRNITLVKAQDLVKEALTMDDAESIKAFIEDALETAGLGSLIRAGR